ncbi:MAG TPA: signal peptidase I [Phycisphaerales bacterium]|nr:signal peptidase I [Phycisphaerales bacterium]
MADTTIIDPAATMPKMAQPQQTNLKETFTSIIIAFAMAFIFRGFVVEAFVIPTGSMAPTLRGAHIQWRDNESGYEWATGPQKGDMMAPNSVQTEVAGINGYTSRQINAAAKPLSGGDRIFVLKYLYSVYDPKRFDVVVFKNPTDPPQSYIKRLLGLPGEQVALVDGDVFVRKPKEGEDPKLSWNQTDWRVQPKPEHVQRALWMDVFDSSFTPIRDSTFRTPFRGVTQGATDIKNWDTTKTTGVYTYTGESPTRLEWFQRGDALPVLGDWYAYNFMPGPRNPFQLFNMSDLRMSVGVRPERDGAKASAVILARGHEFRCDVDGANVVLRMRSTMEADGPWQELATGTLPKPMRAGHVTNIDFWHSDQQVQLWVDDALIATGSYDWSLQERLRNALGTTVEEVRGNGSALRADSRPPRPTGIRWEFSGGPVTLYRVKVQRDVYYQPDTESPASVTAALATHPDSQLTLSRDQFFMCGDNSPNSLDGRKWGKPSPWVAAIDPSPGVVHRDLVIGKAFFVYFPALQRPAGRPMMIDAGKMRWVW